jgi:hypothetical protein
MELAGIVTPRALRHSIPRSIFLEGLVEETMRRGEARVRRAGLTGPI